MKMKKIIMMAFVMSMLPTFIFSQTKKIKGTYLFSNGEEYVQIDNDSFKIIRTHVCPSCLDLGAGDSIVAYGSVEYIKDGFIRIKTDIDSVIYKNVRVEEFYDTGIKDSVKIEFVFSV